MQCLDRTDGADKRFATFTLMAAAMSLCPHAASAQRADDDLDGRRAKRQAIVYAPSENPAGGQCLVPRSIRGQHAELPAHESALAWPEAVVVYFQGLPSRDGLAGWQVERGQDADRDLKLVDIALTSLRATYKVDETRIYSTGFSNGANFTYLLWAERPSVFAAFAPVAARLRPSVKPTQPKPLFHVAGTQDAQIPFADQRDAIEVAKRVDGAGKGASCGAAARSLLPPARCR